MSGVLAEISCVFPSDLGWMAARWTGPRLAAFTFDQPSAQQAARHVAADPAATIGDEQHGNEIFGDERAGDHVRRFRRRMQAYARGEHDDFLDVLLEQQALTPFQQRVLAHCRRVSWGQTLSYAQLAARAGSPGAARAVGNVMARNRFPLIIPCHRVVGSAGALGGFSSPNGLATKQRLLERERKEMSGVLLEGRRP